MSDVFIEVGNDTPAVNAPTGGGQLAGLLFVSHPTRTTVTCGATGSGKSYITVKTFATYDMSVSFPTDGLEDSPRLALQPEQLCSNLYRQRRKP